MKGPKKLLSMIGVLIMLGAMLVPAVVFADAGDVAGTFSSNSLPTIEYVKLYNAAGGAEVTAMTPQTAFDVKVKVADADLKADLTTIVVKIYYDNDTEGTTEAEYTAISAGNAQTAIIITWTEGATFVLTEEEGSSWVLGTCIEPGTLAGDFEFKFTVGKVATEAAGGVADDWQIAAEVTDDSSATAWAADSDGSTMTWYGELSVAEPATVAWGTIKAGLDFIDADADATVDGAVTYISNGAYDEKVKTSTPWSPTADLDDTGACETAQQFALRADDTGAYNTESCPLVNTTGVVIDDAGAQTAEAGVAGGTNTLWLKLASTFTKADYSGTITYIIANGS